MSLQDSYRDFLQHLPGVKEPIRKLGFKEKMKYTGLVLVVFFVMSQIMVYGIRIEGLQQLKVFELLLASKFGSLTTLGIGPIVVAAIILQLLVGSKILPWDMTKDEDKALFQGTQKVLAIALCFVEGAIYVLFGAIPPTPGLEAVVITLRRRADNIHGRDNIQVGIRLRGQPLHPCRRVEQHTNQDVQPVRDMHGH